MRLAISTSLQIDYPAPMIMALPIKLCVIGLVLEGELVVAYEGSRQRVHVCFLDELATHGSGPVPASAAHQHKSDDGSSDGEGGDGEGEEEEGSESEVEVEVVLDMCVATRTQPVMVTQSSRISSRNTASEVSRSPP